MDVESQYLNFIYLQTDNNPKYEIFAQGEYLIIYTYSNDKIHVFYRDIKYPKDTVEKSQTSDKNSGKEDVQVIEEEP